MKKVLLGLFCMLSVNIFAQENFEMKVEEDFSLMIRAIQTENELQVQYSKIVYGNLDDNGNYLALVEYGLGEEGSNGVILKKAKIYTGNDSEIKEVGEFEPDFCFSLHQIKGGVVSMFKLSSCMEEAGAASPVVKYSFENNTLIKK